MRNRVKKVLLLAIALMSWGEGWSSIETGEIDGLYYRISSYTNTASITSPDEGDYSGDIVIPEEITYNGSTYPVTSIFGYAFCYARELTSVSIPQTVTEIGVNAFLDCRSLTSIVIPKSVVTIEPAAFEGCRSLKSIIFEEGDEDLVFERHSQALVSENFRDSPLESIVLGRNIVSQDATSPFGELNPVKTLFIKNTDKIQSDSYRGLEKTSIVIVPTLDDVQKVDDYFLGTVYSNNVAYVPYTQQCYLAGLEFTLWQNPYRSPATTISRVMVGDKEVSPDENGMYQIDGLTPDSTYRVSVRSYYQLIRVRHMTVLLPDGTKGGKIVRDTIMRTVVDSAKLTTLIPSVESIEQGISQTIYEGRVVTNEDKTLSPSEKGLYLVKDEETSLKYQADAAGNIKIMELTPNEEYEVIPYAIYNEKEYLGARKSFRMDSVYVYNNLESISSTSVKLKVQCGSLDGDWKVKERGVNFEGQNYIADSKSSVVIEGLTPKQDCWVSSYVIVENVKTGKTLTFRSKKGKYTTKVPKFQSISESSVTSTSISIEEWPYELYGATLSEVGFSSPHSVIGNRAFFSGLEPNTTYTVNAYLKVEEGNYMVTSSSTFKTSSLVLNTLKAKAASNSKAVICAETNITDEEACTGFEWRRIDAPDLVPSEEVYCAVSDGAMEGILNGLSANTYYKYRPFYKSSAGKVYYGEWIGFGTADAYVYFTPTVRTYASTQSENNSVTLKGYALAGSDDVIEQGFEYWQEESATRGNNVTKVIANGQRMSVLVENLEYGTRYKYRAFVTTTKETIYGETQMFETPMVADVEDVMHHSTPVISSRRGVIYIGNVDEECRARVFTLSGVEIYEGYDREIRVGSGIYIVCTDTITQKLVVK